MLLCLLLLPTRSLAAEILDRFTVRIHSRIVEKGRAWARLWYLLRGLDSQGSGYVRLPAALPIGLLATSSSTLRQWLREGKEAGAFRKWKIQRGILRVAMGGLFAVCRHLGLAPDQKKRVGIAPWGVVSEVGLHQILSLQNLRAAATASTAQRLQQLSRFAAWRNLPAPARKTIRLPQPEAFFVEGQHRPFDDSASRGIRCCIHISKHRIWASKGFIPFGASQHAIARERGVCDRTVQRHLALMNVERRQLVQSKSEYRVAASAINHDGGSVAMADNFALYERGDDYYLSESGKGGTHIHRVATVSFSRIHSRFFSYGKKPKIWLYRCNIYKPDLKLCTMSAARSRYRRGNVLQNSRAGGGTTLCNAPLNSLENFGEPTPYPAEKD